MLIPYSSSVAISLDAVENWRQNASNSTTWEQQLALVETIDAIGVDVVGHVRDVGRDKNENSNGLATVLNLLFPILTGSPRYFPVTITSHVCAPTTARDSTHDTLREENVCISDVITTVRMHIASLLLAPERLRLLSVDTQHDIFAFVHKALWQTNPMEQESFSIHERYVTLLFKLFSREDVYPKEATPLHTNLHADAYHALRRVADSSWQYLRASTLTAPAMVHFQYVRQLILDTLLVEEQSD
jgi:hypothetical protein